MNYWVTSSNWGRENGVPYWNEAAFGRPQYEVTEALVESLNARTLDYYIYHWDDEPQSSLQTRLDGALAGIKKDDIVFIQFPMYTSNSYIKYFIDYLQHQIGAKCVGIVHDVRAWQNKNSIEEVKNLLRSHESNEFAECEFLSQMDGLIVHNRQMAKRLKADFEFAGLKCNDTFSYIDVFGYSAKRNMLNWKRQLNNEIDFAGNLNKGGFLVNIPSTVFVNVFGQKVASDSPLHAITENIIPNIKYHGNYDHEAITSVLTGSFGLCWSSNSYPEITGWSGEYEKYNSPYKAAMYLAADEPIIVAKQSALANFVEAHEIGLVLDDLSELEPALQSITNDQYDLMIEKVHRIGNLVRINFPIKRAALEMITKLEWKA